MNAAQTDEGAVAWEAIMRCGGQLRVDDGRPFALDFGAVLTFAEAMGALSPLLVDVLPSIEPIILKAYRKDGG